MEGLVMETKVCGRCKLEKNIDNFRLILKAEDNLKKGTKINYQLIDRGDAQ